MTAVPQKATPQGSGNQPQTLRTITITSPPTVLPDDLAKLDDFGNVCRLCATVAEYVLPLYEYEGEKFDMAGKIRKYLPIKLSASERMPQGVCGTCAAAVLSWHELVRGARLADLMLRRRLGALENKPPEPKPSESSGSEVSKNGVTYVDAATDAPALPAERRCSVCSLMVPAKRYNGHVQSEHSAVTFRCEECHSYLDKDDLLFHMNAHAFDLLPPALKAQYYENEGAILEEEARLDALAQAEVDRLNDYFQRRDEEEARERAGERRPGAEERETDAGLKSGGTVDEVLKREGDEAKAEHPPQRNSEAEPSPTRRKRSEQTRNPNAEPAPAKRQAKTRRATARESETGRVRDGAGVAPADGTDAAPAAGRTCPICGKQYRASSSYFYHMKYFHKRSREHECPVCRKRFGTRANLTQHASTHSGVYELECKECGKRFKSKASLYIHEQSHGGAKRWSCAQCGRSFRWRTHLARHAQRHAAERAHVCTECGRGFSVRCDLLRHARTHAAAEYRCARCPLKFAQKRYLQVHVGRKHAAPAASAPAASAPAPAAPSPPAPVLTRS